MVDQGSRIVRREETRFALVLNHFRFNTSIVGFHFLSSNLILLVYVGEAQELSVEATYR
jgi:hypothetical protein